jgi:hypothetical protein
MIYIRTECRCTTKEETSSPNVRTHSLFLTAVIAALEGRKRVLTTILMKTPSPAVVRVCDPEGRRKTQHIFWEDMTRMFFFALMAADAQFSFLTEQMSLKRGLKHFKKSGLEALMAEMSQLHYWETIKPVFADSMTREQKRQALRYLMFLKEKRCGRIKARGCTDGRPKKILVPLPFARIHCSLRQSLLRSKGERWSQSTSRERLYRPTLINLSTSSWRMCLLMCCSW